MSDIAAKFQAAEIAPNIIPNAPQHKLQVNYNGILVEPGEKLSTNDVRFGPRINFEPDMDSNYSLVMIDPDNLSRKNPSVAEWLHWCVVNIPASNLKDGMIGGQLVMAYGSPAPQPRTEQHRYVILLYQQTQRVSQQKIEQRAKFKVKAWAEKHKLGDPVAGNFFISEHAG